MSIDPLKIKAIVQQAARQIDDRKGEPRRKDFERLFEGMLSNHSRTESAAGQAESLLKLAKLQMLNGLFADDESSSRDLFDGFGLDSFAASSGGRSQQVARIYRQMEPTLREDKTVGRTDIERMIDQIAEQVSLAPELIRSVVAAESDFQPQAVSPAGAQGLMQLMPETAQDLGVEDCFDPQQNLLAGSRYLKQLFDKYDGDLDKTLAAYNWGQGNVDRMGLEQMPEETRNYLAKVKGTLAGNT